MFTNAEITYFLMYYKEMVIIIPKGMNKLIGFKVVVMHEFYVHI